MTKPEAQTRPQRDGFPLWLFLLSAHPLPRSYSSPPPPFRDRSRAKKSVHGQWRRDSAAGRWERGGGLVSQAVHRRTWQRHRPPILDLLSKDTVPMTPPSYWLPVDCLDLANLRNFRRAWLVEVGRYWAWRVLGGGDDTDDSGHSMRSRSLGRLCRELRGSRI